MLASSGCNFHFKGGSCLMLLLSDKPHRLSIDIDIICPPGTDIETYLTKFKEYGFLDYKSIERIQRGANIPKSHCKFFYKVAFLDDCNRKEHILLDVLNEDCHYINTLRVPIRNPFLSIVGKSNEVSVPSIDDILGDKLTAFAPNTTGIPYYKGDSDCSLEIIKQLYDIGRLFDLVDNLCITGQVFEKIASVELSYRGFENDKTIIYNDIRNTALCFATQGKEGVGNYDRLVRGVSNIKPFMFQNKYSLEDAVTDAAKAAYIVTCIERGLTTLNKYSGDPTTIADMELPSTLSTRLNKLKRRSPGAYFYWAQVGSLL
jgi:hypothetical protein